MGRASDQQKDQREVGNDADEAGGGKEGGLQEAGQHQQDRRIRLLLRAEPAGPYAAANEALAISRGTYLARTDADDMQPIDRLQQQLTFLRTSPGVRACVSHWQAIDEEGHVRRGEIRVPRPGAFKWYLLLRGASIHSSLFMETAALRELGGYRPLPLSQDYRLWCELTRRGWLGVVPRVLSYVRFHDQRSTNRRAALQRRLAQDVQRDHWLALTRTSWDDSEVELLWAAAYSLPCDVGQALRILDRWEAHWQCDPALDRADRAELASLAALRRVKLLRANVRRHPIATLAQALREGWRRPAEFLVAPWAPGA